MTHSLESTQARKLLRHLRNARPQLYETALKRSQEEPEPIDLLPAIQTLFDTIKDPGSTNPQKVTAVMTLMELRQ